MFLISIGIITIIVVIFIIQFKFKTNKLYDKMLYGHHIMITGGSRGIGKCVAMEAARLGANITIVARDATRLKAAANDIKSQFIKKNQKLHYISIDLGSEYNSVKNALDCAIQEIGPLYMLVNCAGMAICGTLEEMSINDILKLINVNLISTIQATKAVISDMKKTGHGTIVITASQAAMCGIYGLGVYSATKFALRGFAEALSMETKAYGIKITLALPSDTDTPGFAEENKSKPLETLLISESGHLFTPEQVGHQIFKDALEGNFFSTIGFEGHLLTIGCSGMAPCTSYFELVCQVVFSGLLRLIVIYYQAKFYKIIKTCKLEREENSRKIS
ncbi:3-ketodihydrosphingosine reductase [Adelges cooleyi]|uniref:3-ketodihydrosphingosine reductase n=1 Tax=Adelges cooleyi TaxID=133065 RepID=UPI0021802FC7|nr:3-ketodihydrosphingosine reductase [Adelges cooleyi]